LKSFPVLLRIYLVPKLNVLTIEKRQGDTSIDHLLTNLVDFYDEGKQLSFKESRSILAHSDERIYKWLHSYAGLHLQTIQRSS